MYLFIRLYCLHESDRIRPPTDHRQVDRRMALYTSLIREASLPSKHEPFFCLFAVSRVCVLVCFQEAKPHFPLLNNMLHMTDSDQRRYLYLKLPQISGASHSPVAPE